MGKNKAAPSIKNPGLTTVLVGPSYELVVQRNGQVCIKNASGQVVALQEKACSPKKALCFATVAFTVAAAAGALAWAASNGLLP